MFDWYSRTNIFTNIIDMLRLPLAPPSLPPRHSTMQYPRLYTARRSQIHSREVCCTSSKLRLLGTSENQHSYLGCMLVPKTSGNPSENCNPCPLSIQLTVFMIFLFSAAEHRVNFKYIVNVAMRKVTTTCLVLVASVAATSAVYRCFGV